MTAVYRVNFGDWYSSEGEALAHVEGDWIHTIEQGERGDDGEVQVVRITICD